MDAHKRIWAWPAFGPESVTGSWSANTYHDERTVAYILATEHDRIVAEKDAEIARLRHDRDYWRGRAEFADLLRRLKELAAKRGDDNG